MVAAPSLVQELSQEEQRVIFWNVPWKVYVLLRDAIDEPGWRMTYCAGALEIMTPSPAHEKNKKLIARLVEHYSLLTRGRLNGYGSTTFKNAAAERGAEPDECYAVGRDLLEGGMPDIVLEVIETRPALDKLSVYDGLGVPEVWLFEAGRLAIHRRRSRGGYARARRSAFLPDLDPGLVERFATFSDQEEALLAFAESVRKKRRKRRRRG